LYKRARDVVDISQYAPLEKIITMKPSLRNVILDHTHTFNAIMQDPNIDFSKISTMSFKNLKFLLTSPFSKKSQALVNQLQTYTKTRRHNI